LKCEIEKKSQFNKRPKKIIKKYKLNRKKAHTHFEINDEIKNNPSFTK
jgi:hypothetical protein